MGRDTSRRGNAAHAMNLVDRVRRLEEKSRAPGKDAIDWPALLAHVARHGKRLVFHRDGELA
jgi:hypothetical protein